MLQLESMAAVPAGSGGEDGEGAGRQSRGVSGCGILHPSWAAAGVALGGHIPSIRVDVGQPRLKNALVQCGLTSLQISPFLSCRGNRGLKKGTEIFFFAV